MNQSILLFNNTNKNKRTKNETSKHFTDNWQYATRSTE